MIIVVKPLPAGQPKSDSIPTNNSKSDKPVIISGITKGAVIIPVNKGLALNFLNLTKAIEARVPKQMAMEALIKAIFRLNQADCKICGSLKSSPYHFVEKPPQTVTNLDLLKLKTINKMIGI